jgi:hypothetical protein
VNRNQLVPDSYQQQQVQQLQHHELEFGEQEQHVFQEGVQFPGGYDQHDQQFHDGLDHQRIEEAGNVGHESEQKKGQNQPEYDGLLELSSSQRRQSDPFKLKSSFFSDGGEEDLESLYNV